MLYNINIKQLLFIDIETVPITENFNDLPKNIQELWIEKIDRKAKSLNKLAWEIWLDSAGVFAEFSKIICISLGYIRKDNELRITSFAHDDEAKLLTGFTDLLRSHFNDNSRYNFCGHNIKEFDIPFICRRLLINKLRLPDVLNLYGLKPWEVNHIDTLELWKFGDRKNYSSLNLLANILGIKTPKDDISGKDVAKVYYLQKDLKRIVNYCQKDVLTVANLIRKFKNEQIFENEDVVIVPNKAKETLEQQA